MPAASFFSLIIPVMAHAKAALGSATLAAAVVIAAVMFGAVALALINRYVPHEHFVLGRQGIETRVLRRIWLFVIAITLQNFPEGLAVAAALRSLDYSRLTCFLIGCATGLIEPIGGLLVVTAVTVFAPLLPWDLGFAAGAMLFVVSNEIIPETHRRGNEEVATFGLMIGTVLMMFLDVTLTK